MTLLVATTRGAFARNRYDVYALAERHSEPD
jgi:hypothetical protein